MIKKCTQGTYPSKHDFTYKENSLYTKLARTPKGRGKSFRNFLEKFEKILEKFEIFLDLVERKMFFSLPFLDFFRHFIVIEE